MRASDLENQKAELQRQLKKVLPGSEEEKTIRARLKVLEAPAPEFTSNPASSSLTFELAEEIEQLLSQDKVQEAINRLLPLPEYRREAVGFSRRYHHIQKQRQRGLITQDEVEATINTIVDSILEVITTPVPPVDTEPDPPEIEQFKREDLKSFDEELPDPHRITREEIPQLHNVFIAYAEEDYDTAEKLYHSLERETGISPWMLSKNQYFAHDIIVQALQQCSYLLVLLSSYSLKEDGAVKGNVQKVLDLFEAFPNNKRRVILLKLDDSQFPESFPEFWMDVKFSSHYESTFRQILDKLRLQIDLLDDDTILEMLAIPGGKFSMGPPQSKNLEKKSASSHHVSISPFYMSKYPITQAQWRAVIEAVPEGACPLESEPFNWKDDKNRPAENISWLDAVEFCRRLSLLTGRNYRLPTEAEWEYACRAGTTTPFYFGETITSDLANYNGSETFANWPPGVYRRQTLGVGHFPLNANAFGLYDMHGNVWEWCADSWHPNYKGAPADGRVWVAGRSEERVKRGGCWASPPQELQSRYRLSGHYTERTKHCGFRVVYSEIEGSERRLDVVGPEFAKVETFNTFQLRIGSIFSPAPILDTQKPQKIVSQSFCVDFPSDLQPPAKIRIQIKSIPQGLIIGDNPRIVTISAKENIQGSFNWSPSQASGDTKLFLTLHNKETESSTFSPEPLTELIFPVTIFSPLPIESAKGKDFVSKERRVDAAIPGETKVGQSIDLYVQVRFPDSELLTIDIWPLKRRPDSIEIDTDTLEIEFPRDPITGTLKSTTIVIQVVTADFTIAGNDRKIIEIPPDKYSKKTSFLLKPLQHGPCRVDIDVYTIDEVFLGQIPLDMEVTEIPPEQLSRVGYLYLPVEVIEQPDRQAPTRTSSAGRDYIENVGGNVYNAPVTVFNQKNDDASKEQSKMKQEEQEGLERERQKRLERERLEELERKKRFEQQRLERERLEELERKKRFEQQRLERERLEELERKKKLEQQRLERERLEELKRKKKLEQQRLERERLKQERRKQRRLWCGVLLLFGVVTGVFLWQVFKNVVPVALIVALRSEPVIVAKPETLGLEEQQSDYGFGWVPKRFINNDFEARGEVVSDHATGLMWQQAGSPTRLSYEEALRYVDGLNRRNFAGYHDWRLPTLPELISLLEPEKQANNIFINPIFDKTQDWCWSADTDPSKLPWIVRFRHGFVHLPDGDKTFYVRAVRSISPEVPQHRLVQLRSASKTVAKEAALQEFHLIQQPQEDDKGAFEVWRPRQYLDNNFELRDALVIDHTSGLIWQQSGSEDWLRYEDAEEYITQLNQEKFAGYNDWRLPTIPELMSLLLPEKQSHGAYIATIFDAKQIWCWSADRLSANEAWGVRFRYGNVSWGKHSDENNYVRAVRSFSRNSSPHASWRDTKTSMDFVGIPAGCFQMGSPEDEAGRDPDEGPVHEVCVDEAWLGRYEITQGQWAHIMQKNSAVNNSPVGNMTWDAIRDFLRTLNDLRDDVVYRLPTEAEWEYACRAGTSTAYSFGDEADELDQYGWYSGNSEERPHPVGKLKANPWGLYDMHGNMWEMCWDWYDEQYYAISPAEDRGGPASGDFHVLRGGSWSREARDLRCAHRYSGERDSDFDDFGIRLAVSRVETKPLSTEEEKALHEQFGLQKQQEGKFEFWRPQEYSDIEFVAQREVVVDRTHGLMWQKAGSERPISYHEAHEYIRQLNRDKFAGYSDWRLPTLAEFISLLTPGKENGDLYIAPLFDKTQRRCWSAEKRESTDMAWIVTFHYGNVYWWHMDKNQFVRAVRSLSRN